MLVLTVDTSTPAVTAGLVRVGDPDPGAGAGAGLETLAVRVTRDARAHAEVLTPQIIECLAGADAAVTSLDAVVVGSGPGPFTGLRVGMATAAAFADALGIPVYGVCSLDAIAAAARVETGAALPGEYLAITDARRREVYWARYRGTERVEGPSVGAPAGLETGDARAGAGSPEHVALVGLPAVGPASPTPWGLAAAAAEALRSGATPVPLEPLYLRRPDATEPKPRAAASSQVPPQGGPA